MDIEEIAKAGDFVKFEDEWWDNFYLTAIALSGLELGTRVWLGDGIFMHARGVSDERLLYLFEKFPEEFKCNQVKK